MKGLKVFVLSALLAVMALVILAPVQRAEAVGPSACSTAASTGAVQMYPVNGGRKGILCQNVGATITGYIAIGTGNTCVAGTAGNALQITPGAIFEESSSGCQGTTGCVPTGDISICTSSSVTTFCCDEW